MTFLRYAGPKGDADYLDVLQTPDVVRIDARFTEPNVAMNFTLDQKPVFMPLDDMSLDFLDFATCLYIADEIVAREGAEDRWNRDLDLCLPVRDFALWNGNRPLVEEVVRSLSGDSLNLRILPRQALPRTGRHRKRLPRGYDVVCLFSGGLDSLLGAYNLLKAGKKVLLVGHQADGITASTQKTLAGRLKLLFPTSVQFLQCRVARRQTDRVKFPLPDKSEDSHRPRSLLFLALAIAVARTAGINDVVIPENGLIALNIPLQPSRRGTLSTKTAHPKYLLELNMLSSGLGLLSGGIRNPFLYDSKTDVVRGAESAIHRLLLRSNSCAHAGALRWEGVAGIKQCGYCVPCIYRRLALYACGLDDSKAYLKDVFQELGDLSAGKQADLRALIQFARRIASLPDSSLEVLVLEHGYFPPDVGTAIGPAPSSDYRPWANMLRKWAIESLDALLNLCSDDTKRIVGLGN